MRYIIGFVFLFLGVVGFAQVERTAGIAIGTTVPTHTPSTQGALKYYNRSSGVSYRWTGSAWTVETVDLSGYLQWSDTATLATKHYVDSQGFLTAEVDGSITNEIQQIDTFSISGTTISASLSSDGVPAKTLDLSGIGLISSGVAGYLVQYTGATSQDTISAYWDATTGRLGVGIASSLLARLHVKGPSTNSSTTALLVENSAGTDMWLQRDDQVVFNYNKRMDWQSTTGSVGIGNSALMAEDQTSSSRHNVAIGFHSLLNNTTGSGNVGLGFYTLRNNTTGSSNLAIGSETLQLNTGHENVAIGTTSMRDKAAGNNNIGIGVLAGYRNVAGTAITTVNNSIFIGYDTRPLVNNGTNETVIALYGRGLGSNTTRIGNSSTTRTHLDGTVTVGTASNNVGWYTGTGSPESVVTANVGCIYTDIAGGAGTTLYVKESGTGNTGWIAK